MLVSTIPFDRDMNANVEGVLFVSSATNVPEGSSLTRHKWADMPNTAGGMIKHPKHPFLMETGKGWLPSGPPGCKLTMEYWWTEEEGITLDMLNTHQRVMKEIQSGGGDFKYVEKDMDARYAKAELVTSYNRTSWTEYPFYDLAVNRWKMTLDKGMDLVCALRIAEEYSEWDTELLDVLPNTTVTVERPKDYKDCYVLFSSNCSINNAAVQRAVAYKLRTPKAIIKAGNAGTRIIRIYRKESK